MMKHTCNSLIKVTLRLVLIALAASCLLTACKQVPGGEQGSQQTEQTQPGTPQGTDSETVTEQPTQPSSPSTPTENAEIHPIPMEITYAQGYVAAKIRLDPAYERYQALLQSAGFTVAEDGLPLGVTLCDMSGELAYGADEGYILDITGQSIAIKAQTERGVHYAMMTLAQLIGTDGMLPAATVKDAPRNSLRGVIEGFYGAAWTHEYRKDLFAFMGQNKMNAYIYAPKDDPKHRAQWRSLYSGDELARMTDLIETANAHYVKFIYAISPGGDIDLGGGYEADFEKLVAKCEQMYHLGVRDFAIFLDDIPTLDAAGHGKLLSDFQTRFVKTHDGVSDLIAITTEYGDPFLTDYTNQIAPLIDKDVVLMWTGPGVIPESITNQSLKHILRVYDRKVLIWWNYPVNDTLANHLFMGPCVNLENTLYKSIHGLTANPMNQGYASLVPLFTTGEYLWNPEAYDSTDSLDAACRALMPDADKELLDFISMTCASGINKNTDSAELKALLDAFKKENSLQTRTALREYFAQMVSNADAIGASQNQSLVKEISEWLDKYRAMGQMGMLYMDMEQAYADGAALEAMLRILGEYKALEQTVQANPRVVSAAVLQAYLSTLNTRFAVLLGQSEGLSFAPAIPYTNCNHYQDFLPDYMLDGDDSTYFWTHGDLNTAAGGGNGYFGVDLGEALELTNVYIATGVGGGDALASGIVEYSLDEKTWSTLYEGNCGDELFLDGLCVTARYVRIRANAAGTSWVKVRAFEVNTTRAVAGSQAGVPTWSSSLPVYQTYGTDFMKDNDPGTYFWSSTGAKAGDYIQIDLGQVTSVSRIIFAHGVPAHAADSVKKGELCYSADGRNWTVLCPIAQGNTDVNVNINARYIRVRITAEQVNWITVSEFRAVSQDNVSSLIQLDSDFADRTELLALTDGLYTTAFSPKNAQGHTLQITMPQSGKIKLIFLSLPQGGVNADVTDGSDTTVQSIALSYVTEIQAPAGAVVSIPLGNGLVPAEIEW